jgi:hypothetical protein
MGVLAAVASLLLGALTFGVQATAGPRSLPLGIGPGESSSSSRVSPLIDRAVSRSGSEISWTRVSSRPEAERLLDSKKIYGALLLSPTTDGVSATVLTSGATNPGAAQIAQPLLSQVGESLTASARAQAGAARPPQPSAAAPPPPSAPRPAVTSVTIHPASAAGRTIPLAASALLWIGTLVATLVALLADHRLTGGPRGTAATLALPFVAAAGATVAVAALVHFWDDSLPLGWDVVGFLALVALGFAALQTAVLRWLGTLGAPVLALLYLTAPAVGGQAPELLNPVYRVLLWSWTPFRVSTEGLRSLLFLGPRSADVTEAVWVFASVAAIGLALVLVRLALDSIRARRQPAPLAATAQVGE